MSATQPRSKEERQRVLAPHVGEALKAGQGRVDSPTVRQVAPHVQAALDARQAKAENPVVRQIAPHLRMALGIGQAKPESPASQQTARHVQEAIGAAQAKPASPMERQVASHIKSALGARCDHGKDAVEGKTNNWGGTSLPTLGRGAGVARRPHLVSKDPHFQESLRDRKPEVLDSADPELAFPLRASVSLGVQAKEESQEGPNVAAHVRAAVAAGIGFSQGRPLVSLQSRQPAIGSIGLPRPVQRMESDKGFFKSWASKKLEVGGMSATDAIISGKVVFRKLTEKSPGKGDHIFNHGLGDLLPAVFDLLKGLLEQSCRRSHSIRDENLDDFKNRMGELKGLVKAVTKSDMLNWVYFHGEDAGKSISFSGTGPSFDKIPGFNKIVGELRSEEGSPPEDVKEYQEAMAEVDKKGGGDINSVEFGFLSNRLKRLKEQWEKKMNFPCLYRDDLRQQVIDLSHRLIGFAESSYDAVIPKDGIAPQSISRGITLLKSFEILALQLLSRLTTALDGAAAREDWRV